MNKLPLARSTDIIVQELGKEVLIYDLQTHKAFNLNKTSSIVYLACDGNTTFKELKLKSKFTDDLIFLALDQLQNENLLDENQLYDSPFAGISRRAAVKRVGLATIIALPVIYSLIAPTAAMALSVTATAPTCAAKGQVVTKVGATSSPQCRSMLQSACCSGTLSVTAIACRTVGGVTTCPTCTATCA
jgi:hypothetical protein